MDGSTLGNAVTQKAIPQVCGYAQQCDDQENFWRQFFSGMAGAMAAQLGHDAAIRVLNEAVGITTQHAQIIKKQTH